LQIAALIRWHNLPWALLAIAVMVAVIVADNLWFLDYVHVFSSLLWTGIDLFMGFVLGKSNVNLLTNNQPPYDLRGEPISCEGYFAGSAPRLIGVEKARR
jgi:hypothetical protein